MRSTGYSPRPAVIKWLLDSDPAIRWQVLRDLADASPEDVAAERAKVATEGWGAKLLARQAPNGKFGGAKEPPRRRRASMREVAERAGVAIRRSPHALGSPRCQRGHAERVLAAVDELGYKPDLLAQGLRSRTSLTVGFVADDISNPLLAQIARGAEVRCARPGTRCS